MEVNGQGIEDVDKFVYLGATVFKEGGDTQDIGNRVVKARGVFMRLRMICSSKPKSGYIRLWAGLFESRLTLTQG